MPSRRRKRTLHVGLMVVTMFVTAAATVPAAWFGFPLVQRWRRISQLDSADLSQREQALNFVLRRAPIDPTVRAAAIRRLATLENEPFAMLTMVLDQAGLWRRPTIPDDPWLRWLDLGARAGDESARIAASQRLADLHDLADDPRVTAMLARFLADESPDARYNALAAAAELSGAARDRTPYDKLIVAACDDPQPIIARKAWLYTGLLKLEHQARPILGPGSPPEVATGISPQRPGAPPEVAQAIVFATGLDLDEQDDSIHPAVRLIARYVHGRIERPAIDPLPDDLDPLFASELPGVRDVACVTAVERLSHEALTELAGGLLRSFDDPRRMSGAMLCGLSGVRPVATLRREAREVDLLQYVGEYPGYELSQIVRLALWMRDESRLPEAGNRRGGGGAAMSEDQRMITTALGLLSRQDLPTSTILLALLHRGRPEALDYLLVPRGEPEEDYLLELLIGQRWWLVLWRYLPADAPRLWLAGEEALLRFQLELLREWWVLHRHQPGVVARRGPLPPP